MAKILSRGRPTPKRYHHKCLECNSKIEYTESDRVDESDQYKHTSAAYVECLVCKKHILWTDITA
jgi:uncharacterized protein with PIN domain